MKAILINGSPRKEHNTHELLKAAARGAEAAGAECEIVHLYDIDYKGCRSCFACKLKDGNKDGLCVMQDGLRPVLESIMEADVLIVGTPIYFGNITGEVQSFLERLQFPILRYRKPQKGVRPRYLPKPKKVGLIADMNAPEAALVNIGYDRLINTIALNLGVFLSDGKCPTLCSCDTYQFDDYDKYDVNMFSEPAKRKQREEQFPKDLEKAFELGKSLCE